MIYKSTPRSTNAFINVGAAIVPLGIGYILWRSLFQAQAQSFDALLYSRNLFGIAHNLPINPEVGVHGMAVHAHWGNYLLAPLAWFIPATLALIITQTFALWITLSVFALAWFRIANQRLIGWLGLLFAILSPVIINPFIFDVRPGLLGIPLVFLAYLRIWQRKEYDWMTIALFATGLAMREELAMLIVPALLFTPTHKGLTVKIRWAIATFFTIYWTGYIAYGRGLFGGDLAEARVQGVVHLFIDAQVSTIGAKAAMLMIVLTTLGGLVLIGWRWLVPALPGLAFLLLNNRSGLDLLSSHYTMFVMPILMVAALDGLARLSQYGITWSRKRWGLINVSMIIIAAGGYVAASALPGGGLFRGDYFDLMPAKRPNRPSAFSHSPSLTATHAMLDRIPPKAPLAAPWQFIAGHTDREVVISSQRLKALVTEKKPIPQGLEWVALRDADIDLGRFLIEQEGFAYVDHIPGMIWLLQRMPVHETRIAELARVPIKDCIPLRVWPEAGLALCMVGYFKDGRSTATLMRFKPADPSLAGIALRLVVRGSQETVILRCLGGIFNPQQLPEGKGMRLIGPTFAMGSKVAVHLIDKQARHVPPESERLITPTVR